MQPASLGSPLPRDSLTVNTPSSAKWSLWRGPGETVRLPLTHPPPTRCWSLSVQLHLHFAPDQEGATGLSLGTPSVTHKRPTWLRQGGRARDRHKLFREEWGGGGRFIVQRSQKEMLKERICNPFLSLPILTEFGLYPNFSPSLCLHIWRSSTPSLSLFVWDMMGEKKSRLPAGAQSLGG